MNFNVCGFSRHLRGSKRIPYGESVALRSKQKSGGALIMRRLGFHVHRPAAENFAYVISGCMLPDCAEDVVSPLVSS